VRLRVTASAEGRETAERMCDEMIEKIFETGLERYVYGIDVATLENAAVRKLIERELTVAVAESLTGGMIGSRIASVPGASGVFLGGCITYQNDVKEQLLGVSAETIARYTGVSMECAREMALGVRRQLNADIGISATGYAGPSGGTEEHPVGTVFIGIAFRTKSEDGKTVISSAVRRLSLSPMRDRAYIRTVSASNALEMLLRAADAGRLESVE
jgi:nicotinamide-nucleotide amidase